MGSMDMENNGKEAPSVNRVDNETTSEHLKKKVRKRKNEVFYASKNDDDESLDFIFKVYSLIGLITIVIVSIYTIIKMAPTEIESGKLTRAKTGPHASSKLILQFKDPAVKTNAVR